MFTALKSFFNTREKKNTDNFSSMSPHLLRDMGMADFRLEKPNHFNGFLNY